jgi:hypothetical protein
LLERAIKLNPNSYKLLYYLGEYKKQMAYSKIDNELKEVDKILKHANELSKSGSKKFLEV